MPRDSKKPANTNRKAHVVKAAGKLDPSHASANRIEKIVRKGGNDDFARKMGMRAGMRDQMLAFLCERLKHVHRVQSMEKAEIKDVQQWFRALARGRKGVLLPDPTRWHLCAQLYKKAGEALASGHLDRGAQLLDKAMEAERAAMDSAPKQVKDELSREQKADAAPPPAMGHVVTGMRCPAIDAPVGLRVADLILNVPDKMDHAPPIRPPRRRRWWDEEEEEEEDEKGNKKGAAP
jgi:hypothetical protein